MRFCFNTKRAFTLLELMIVVTIIAILAGVMIPNFIRSRAQTQLQSCLKSLKGIGTAIEMATLARGDIYPEPGELVAVLAGEEDDGVEYLKGSVGCPVGGQYQYARAGERLGFIVRCSGAVHEWAGCPDGCAAYFSSGDITRSEERYESLLPSVFGDTAPDFQDVSF